LKTLEQFTVRLSPKNRQRLAYLLSFFVDSISKEDKETVRVITEMLHKLNNQNLIYSSSEIGMFMNLAYAVLESAQIPKDLKEEVNFLANLLNDNSMNGDGLAFADYFEMLSEAGKLAENNSSAQ
jgi:hypothetical protein